VRTASVLQKVVFFAACGWLTLMACLATATKYKAPANEVALLPQFCWAQYMDNVEGPEYSIPSAECGVAMNHYCPALLELIEAKRSVGTKARERAGHLNVAHKEVMYTLNSMTNYPNCPIRSHAESTLKEVEALQKMLPRHH